MSAMADKPRVIRLGGGGALQRLVAHRIASKLGDRPDALEKLAKLGLFDPAALEEVPDGDAAAELRALIEGIARRVREQPSLLADVGVRALDVLASEVEHPAALGSGVGAARTVELAVVFTDLEGFTAFTAAEGDDTASRLLDDHYRSVDTVVRGRGGRVVKRLGDGHLVTFAAPEAAVRAGLELLEAAPHGLALRAGTHAGAVTPLGEDVVGSVVNLASRVADAAGGGESLVTGAVLTVVRDLPGVSFGPPRPTHLKGFADTVELVPVGRA
jgi:class 3 adenylate cyclase